MTTHTRQTEVIADPDVPIVRVVREFDAPPAKVFWAHTDPDLLVRWFGPHGTETVIDRWDCHTDGSYRYTHISGEERFAARGCFHEVRADELIVQTFSVDMFPDAVVLERMTFEPSSDGRTRLTITTLADSFEGRDMIIASGMEEGLREGFERLDGLLAP